MTETTEAFETWAILELMGHRRLAGLITEREIAGQNFLQITVPENEQTKQQVTQFYSASAVYCITPTTEETARAVAAQVHAGLIDRFDAQRLLEVPGEPQTTAGFDPDDDEYPIWGPVRRV